MPFINERLDANREEVARAQALANPGRASRFRFEPDTVMSLLRARIVGQDAVLSAMDDMLHTVKADIGADTRPLSVNLFLGPTGVGKTETVRVIAESILGSADKLCRIDMNTLAQEHYAASLTGAPPGYVGSKEGQTLFNVEAIQGSFSKPGLVLFDEIEKSSNEVVRALLNVLDSGRLMLTAGNREIDFRNSIIFMTSNIGATEVATYHDKFTRGWRRVLGFRPSDDNAIVERALHRRFDPEFLNRIDRTLQFQRLNSNWLGDLLTIELAKLNTRLQRRGISVDADASARNYLCSQYDKRFGARDLARRMRTELEPALARQLLAAQDSHLFTITSGPTGLDVIPTDTSGSST